MHFTKKIAFSSSFFSKKKLSFGGLVTLTFLFAIPVSALPPALLSFSQSLKVPNMPTEPTTPQVGGETTKKEEPVAPEQNAKDYAFITVILGNGKKIDGRIKFPPQIVFEHKKDGLLYKLTLKREQIKKIRVQEYQKKLLRQEKENALYSFEPNKILIETTDERIFFIDKIFDFLKKFNILTRDGETTLFAHFADTWHEKQNRWLEIQEKGFTAHDTLPHPLAAREWIPVDK